MKNQKIFLITEGLMTFQKSIFKACLGVLLLAFSMISRSISMNNFDFQKIMEMAEQVQKNIEGQQRPTQNNNAQQNPFGFNSSLNNLYGQQSSSTSSNNQMSEAMRKGFDAAQDILHGIQPTLNFMGNNFASFLQGGDSQTEELIQNSNMTEAHKRGFLAGREVLKDLDPLFTNFSDENDEEEDGEASPQTPDSPEPLEDTFVRKSFQSLKKTVEEFFESQQKILDGEYDFTDILPALAAWGIDGLIIVNDGLDTLTGGAWGTLNELMEKGAKVVQTTVRRTLREDFDVSQSTSQTAGDCSGLFVYVCPAKGISALNSIKILKTKKGLIGSLTEVKNSSLLEKPLLVTKGQNGKLINFEKSSKTPQTTTGSENLVDKIPSKVEKTFSVDNIPSIGANPHNGRFSKWFDSLNVDDFSKYWSNPQSKEKIQRLLREPGGFHEWAMVSRADKFHKWGFSARDIWSFRTATKNLTWINPKTGLSGKHGGHGSGAFHYELGQLIDSSRNMGEMHSKLITLGQRWNIPNLPTLIRR